jgi:hypothetical protein
MNVRRRAPVPAVAMVSPANSAAGVSSDEITYRGYRIEPASYGVNSGTWSPRVVISVRDDDRWSRLTPLYATNAARFLTRQDADKCALDVARAWIDTAIERQCD